MLRLICSSLAGMSINSDVRKSLILPCSVIHSAVSTDVINTHADIIEILDEDITALFEQVWELNREGY